MKNLVIKTAALSGRIYLGKVNKAQDCFLEGKRDVTGECVHAVCEHVLHGGGVQELLCNGIKSHEVAVRKIGQNPKENNVLMFIRLNELQDFMVKYHREVWDAAADDVNLTDYDEAGAATALEFIKKHCGETT